LIEELKHSPLKIINEVTYQTYPEQIKKNPEDRENLLFVFEKKSDNPKRQTNRNQRKRQQKKGKT